MNRKKMKKTTFKQFLKFYNYFQIPWWLFILSSLFGVAFAEISFKIASVMIQVNKGELYNRVIITYVLLNLLNVVISVLCNQFSNYGSYLITLRARGVVWKKIVGMKIKDLDAKNPSKLVSGVINDVEQASIAVSMIFSLIASIYGFGKACIILYRYNATMSKYLLLLIPLAIFQFWFVGITQIYLQRKIYASINTMTSFFSEHLSATKYIKAQAMEEHEIEAGYKAIDSKYKADIMNAFIGQVQVMMFAIYNRCSTIITCFFGAELIRRGKMENSGINSTSTYLEKVNQFMSEILTQYQNISGTQGALTQVNELLEFETEQNEVGLDFVESDNKDIIFENVSFGYNEKEIIHDISFRIPYKKTVAIIGNNGSGKSTLLKLMQGLYMANSGVIKVGDNEIGKVKTRDIRNKFSYILQNDNLFSGTIRDNICYGCSHEVTQEEVEKVAKLVGAHEFITSFPNGYDSLITEAGMNLSGGQRKRISFARAFLQKSDYFLLDEAGANLDKKSYKIIHQSLKEKMKEKTVIFIAHDIEEILTADYVLVLVDGRLEAFGTNEQLQESSTIYCDYLSRIQKI